MKLIFLKLQGLFLLQVPAQYIGVSLRTLLIIHPLLLLFYKSKILISCWVGISLVNMIYCGFFSSDVYLAQELLVE